LGLGLDIVYLSFEDAVGRWRLPPDVAAVEAIYTDKPCARYGGILTTLEPKKRRNSASESRFLGSTDRRLRNAINCLDSG
jgi:hypothetical protein